MCKAILRGLLCVIFALVMVSSFTLMFFGGTLAVIIGMINVIAACLLIRRFSVFQ